MAKLGDICNILDSQRKPVSKSNRQHGDYPYYGANGIQDYVDNYLFDGEYLLLGEDGSVINKDNTPVINWAKGKIWVNNHAHVLSENKEKASLRYIYHALHITDVSDIVRGVPPKINQANMREIEIPLPSLSEQQRIVDILDKFEGMVENVEKELLLRQKQYEFYREKMMNCLRCDSVKWVKIGDVCKTVVPPVKLKTIEYQKEGFYKIIDQGKENFAGYTNDESSLLPHDEYVLYGDHTCIVKYINGRFAQGADGLKILKVENHLTKYLYYALCEYNIESNEYKRHWTIVKEIEIPLPPLDKQQEIVAKLDKFEEMISTLKKELELRKKQYEYYREKLLTFE